MEDPRKFRQEAWGDLVTGLIMLAVVAVGSVYVAGNPELIGASYGSDPGPGLLPILLLVILGLLALTMVPMAFVRILRTGGWKGIPLPTGEEPLSFPWFPLVLVLFLLLYALLLVQFGFIATTLALTLVVLTAIGWQDQGRPNRWHMGLYALEAVALTLGVWVIFEKLINIPLP